MKILRKSYHGNVYSIPQQFVPYFIQLDEAVANAEFGTEEEQDALDDFNREFGEYEKVEQHTN